MAKSVEEVRGDMSYLKDLVYLDSASVVPAPRPVLAAMEEYLTTHPFNYGVGVWRRSVEAAERVNESRRIAARAIGAVSDTEIAFTKNTTEAINLIAQGYQWKAGDEIVLTDLEHQSNAIPWMRAAQEHGGRVRLVRADAEGLVDPGDVRRAMTPATRLVACTHVSNVFGTIQPGSGDHPDCPRCRGAGCRGCRPIGRSHPRASRRDRMRLRRLLRPQGPNGPPGHGLSVGPPRPAVSASAPGNRQSGGQYGGR